MIYFKSLSIRNKKLVAAVLCVVLGLVSFQNCSDVRVSQLPSLPPPEPPVVVYAKPQGSLCAPQGAVFGAPVRIVIILDMSMSNIGSVNAWVDTNNMSHWSIDTGDGPTDLAGQRFDQIRNFIANCGASANVKYSIIGFSNSSQFVRGQSCVSPFETQEEAVRTVDAFKSKQNADIARGGGMGTYPFTLGNETNYTEAIKCLDKKVNEDLILLAEEKPVYHTFFLTDGQPTEDDPQLINVLKAQLTNIQLAVTNLATAFHFQGIYYTSPGAKNGPPQQNVALNILTQITKVTEGPTGAAINVQNLANTQNELCSRIQPNARVDYSLKTMYAVNLTAAMKKINLEADTDADGVTDKEEIAIGWDPKNPRFTGALDGLCYMSARNKDQCAATVATLSCANNAFNLGMSECDRKLAARLFTRQFDSPDVDRDSLPNLIEILRRTAVARADALDNPTSDGVNNFQKVSQGMDVESSTTMWPINPEKLVDLRFDATSAVCDNGLKRISYDIERVPFVDTQDYEDVTDDATINFSHKKDENVVLVFSIWQSSGGITLPNRLYMQKWVVPKLANPKKDEIKFIGEF